MIRRSRISDLNKYLHLQELRNPFDPLSCLANGSLGVAMRYFSEICAIVFAWEMQLRSFRRLSHWGGIWLGPLGNPSNELRGIIYSAVIRPEIKSGAHQLNLIKDIEIRTDRVRRKMTWLWKLLKS